MKNFFFRPDSVVVLSVNVDDWEFFNSASYNLFCTTHLAILQYLSHIFLLDDFPSPAPLPFQVPPICLMMHSFRVPVRTAASKPVLCLKHFASVSLLKPFKFRCWRWTDPQCVLPISNLNLSRFSFRTLHLRAQFLCFWTALLQHISTLTGESWTQRMKNSLLVVTCHHYHSAQLYRRHQHFHCQIEMRLYVYHTTLAYF